MKIDGKWVPCEPTEGMLHAMSRVDGYDHDPDMPTLTRWKDYWVNALNAVPSPDIEALVEGNMKVVHQAQKDWGASSTKMTEAEYVLRAVLKHLFGEG